VFSKRRKKKNFSFVGDIPLRLVYFSLDADETLVLFVPKMIPFGFPLERIVLNESQKNCVLCLDSDP